jgi:hypothetical protein
MILPPTTMKRFHEHAGLELQDSELLALLSPTKTIQGRMSAMKRWVWLLTGVVWMTAVVLAVSLIPEWMIVGVHIPAAKWIPGQVAFAISGLFLCLLLFGWLIPLAIGVKSLISGR